MTRAVLTDIEGTTSSISFVKDVLFPYARKHLPEFVRVHANDADVRRWLNATAQEAGVSPGDDEFIVGVLQRWIDEDRKATPLKALQGIIWKDGYESGAYRAHLYPEVAERLRHWHADGLRLYVYSSGSVGAQKLFFRHSEAGDLTPLLSGYFDTETGPKREADSYAKIAEAIGMPASDILFLSDVIEELDAAAKASMRTTQLCRPPMACVGQTAHPCVSSFDEVEIG